MDETALLMAVLRSRVCGGTLELSERPSPELLKNLYRLAKRHDLAHIVGQTFRERGWLGEDDISRGLKDRALRATYRYVQLEYELEQTCRVLEEAGIPFIPLKGSILRAWYPEPWMRISCDIDILLKPEHLDAAIGVLKETLHYEDGGKSDHDIHLHTAGGIALELHYNIIEDRYTNPAIRDVLSRVWEDATPIHEGSCHLVMSDAMFYFYHIAHMAKHFEVGGCGIRSFLDLWILNHNVEYQHREREALLRKGGLLRFALAAEKLSEVWFSDAPMDEKTRWVSDYILRGSLYGDDSNRAALGQAKTGGKLRYILTRRVFMPYEYLKADYPILEKHKWLTPFCQVARWFRSLCRGEWRRRVRELQLNATVSETEAASAKDMLHYLGLQ